MPVDLLAASSSGPKDLLANSSDKSMPTPDSASDKLAPRDDSFAGGVERGFLERGVGAAEALNQIGVGGIVPQYVNGKIVFGLPPNEQLDQFKEKLEDEGTGTGVKGMIAEMIGDPVNILPVPGLGVAGKVGKMAVKGAEQAAASGVLAPGQNADQTLIDRLKGGAYSAPFGAITGGALGKLGGKEALGAKPTAGLTEGSPLHVVLNKMGIKLTGKETPEVIWDKIQGALKTAADDIGERISPGSSTSNAWSVGTNLAISQTYDKVRNAGSKLYDGAKAIGEKLETPVENFRGDVENLITELEGDKISPTLNPKFNTALQKIKELHANLTEEATPKDPMEKMAYMLNHGGAEMPAKIRGDQLIEIDQALNQLYGKKGQGGAGGKAYSNLQNKVNETIKGMSPEFGAAYQKAKDFWKTQVIHNFKENKALHEFWKPEDYEAFRDMQKGLPLHPNVQTRVMSQLDKIKDWNGLSVLKDSLPPEMYNTIRSAKLVSVLRKEGLDLKAVTDDKAYAMLSRAVGDKPEDIQALDALRTFAEQMQKRGIGQNINPEELKQSDKLLDRSVRTILGFATGHKLSGLTHAWALINRKIPDDAAGKLLNLSTDAAKGAPKQMFESTGLPGMINKPLATGEGDEIPSITIHPNKSDSE